MYDLVFKPGFTAPTGVKLQKIIGFLQSLSHGSNHFTAKLLKIKGNIVIENALQIRNTLGIFRCKYDKIDAIRIATYAYKIR